MEENKRFRPVEPYSFNIIKKIEQLERILCDAEHHRWSKWYETQKETAPSKGFPLKPWPPRLESQEYEIQKAFQEAINLTQDILNQLQQVSKSFAVRADGADEEAVCNTD